MRAIVLLLTFVNSIVVVSQGETQFLFLISGGTNNMSKTNQSTMLYNIDVAENNFKLGYYYSIGMKVDFPGNLNIGVDGFIRNQSRDKGEFDLEFNKRYTGYDVYYENNYSLVLSSSGFKGFVAYELKYKNYIFEPYVSIGLQSSPIVNYSYVVRESSTNYVNEILVKSTSNSELYYSFGMDFGHQKLKWLGLYSNLGFSNNRNTYEVIETDRFFEESNYGVNTTNTTFFVQLGVKFFINLKEINS